MAGEAGARCPLRREPVSRPRPKDTCTDAPDRGDRFGRIEGRLRNDGFLHGRGSQRDLAPTSSRKQSRMILPHRRHCTKRRSLTSSAANSMSDLRRLRGNGAVRMGLRDLLGTVARARCAICCILIGLGVGTANASPWAEVGDSQLRSDIEILANYGLIDGVVTTWPLPWAQISRALSAETSGLPQHVRRSLERVRQRFETEAKPYRQRVTAAAHLTNEPPLVRGFDEVPRRQADLEAGFEYMWSSTAFRLNVGFEGDFDSSAQSFILDGTYLAQEAANLLFYGGYVEQ